MCHGPAASAVGPVDPNQIAQVVGGEQPWWPAFDQFHIVEDDKAIMLTEMSKASV